MIRRAAASRKVASFRLAPLAALVAVVLAGCSDASSGATAPDTKVAEGGVFGLAEGSATIAASREGKEASVELRVVQPPAFDLIYDRPTAAGGAEIFLLGLNRTTLSQKLNAGNV